MCVCVRDVVNTSKHSTVLNRQLNVKTSMEALSLLIKTGSFSLVGVWSRSPSDEVLLGMDMSLHIYIWLYPTSIISTSRAKKYDLYFSTYIFYISTHHLCATIIFVLV